MTKTIHQLINFYIVPEMDDTSYMECFQKCTAQHADLSETDLIKLIRANNCSIISDHLLIGNYTKLGLLNMLCGCLCGEDGSEDESEDEAGSPPSPDLAHTPPVGGRKNA